MKKDLRQKKLIEKNMMKDKGSILTPLIFVEKRRKYYELQTNEKNIKENGK